MTARRTAHSAAGAASGAGATAGAATAAAVRAGWTGAATEPPNHFASSSDDIAQLCYVGAAPPRASLWSGLTAPTTDSLALPVAEMVAGLPTWLRRCLLAKVAVMVDLL